jgi:hypothetical protein
VAAHESRRATRLSIVVRSPSEREREREREREECTREIREIRSRADHGCSRFSRGYREEKSCCGCRSRWITVTRRDRVTRGVPCTRHGVTHETAGLKEPLFFGAPMVQGGGGRQKERGRKASRRSDDSPEEGEIRSPDMRVCACMYTRRLIVHVDLRGLSYGVCQEDPWASWGLGVGFHGRRRRGTFIASTANGALLFFIS